MPKFEARDAGDERCDWTQVETPSGKGEVYDAEQAAEIYAAENDPQDDTTGDEALVDVRDEAGVVTTWAVAIEFEPTYTARPYREPTPGTPGGAYDHAAGYHD